MVRVYFCRHGVAEEASEGMGDAERRLTKEGVKKFREGAKGFLRMVEAEEISHVITSPLVRARETAEILAEAVREKGGKVEVREMELLGTGGKVGAFLKAVRGLKGAVVAVGHEPILSEWVGEICFGRKGRLRMGKGAVAAVELEGGSSPRGELCWVMQGRELRKMG